MQLINFQNDNFGSVRAILQDEQVWFIAKDIAEILSYEQPHKMYFRLDEDEKKTNAILSYYYYSKKRIKKYGKIGRRPERI